jgi:hypothetical protein
MKKIYSIPQTEINHLEAQLMQDVPLVIHPSGSINQEDGRAPKRGSAPF